MYVYDSAHFHMTMVEDEEVIYHFTGFDPLLAIDQFSAVYAMMDDREFIDIHTELVDHVIDCIQSNSMAYVVVGTTKIAQGLWECDGPCRISPSMN